MASRRCVSIDFYHNDVFLNLSHSAIVLYTFLIIHSDDYGIVANPKTVMRICGASDEDISELITNNFLLEFDSGKIAVKHWLVHNQIQNSKLTISPNVYELKQLLVVEDTKEYLLVSDDTAERWRNISAVSPLQYKISKDNTIKGNLKEHNTSYENSKNNISETEENERELLKGKPPDELSDYECQQMIERLRQERTDNIER
jgi:hypothetical protein